VQIALTVLDGSALWRGTREQVLVVVPAKFEQKGEAYEKSKRQKMSESGLRLARLAAAQAVEWDDGENGRVAGGVKGLRIVVLRKAFDPKETREGTPKAKNKRKRETAEEAGSHAHDDDDLPALAGLEREVHTRCSACGEVEKITVFTAHVEGVVVVKFATPVVASNCVVDLHGALLGKDGATDGGRAVYATFWDGSTDFTARVDAVKEAAKEKERIDEFRDWLEYQEDLSEELRLKVVR